MSHETQCLKYFPVSLFASVMGVAGLSIAFQRFSHILPATQVVGLALLALAYLLFMAITVVYLAKVFLYREEVSAEVGHPVRANFFPAISISFLLLAAGTLDISRSVAEPLWIAGSVLHIGFSLYIMSRWITQVYEITHANPTWFIPVVGNIIVPIAGVELAGPEISWFFFSIGFFFWVSLFTIIFYRIIFHHQLAQKFMPTLFILIAPPAVGFIAYVKLTGGMDAFARVLLYMALFFVLLLISMLKYFFQVKFYVSWWAYTFPLCAVTIAATLASRIMNSVFLAWVAGILLALSSLVILLVSFRTIQALYSKKLCEAEE